MAVTEAQINIVKSTVPLLEAGGEALIKHFYKTMLTEYEEVRPLFNQTHQSSGDQARALANAVLRYAKNIDRLENLGPLVGQIVHKHVSLQILPEHYPIVGTCLLRAIREVLGPDVATDDVIEAWGAAYQKLADILIDAEESVYASLESAEGGWRGSRTFKVAKKVKESDEITSFYFSPVDGKPIVHYEPGQYIGIRLFINGEEVRRNYSLSKLSDGETYRISVKREPGGLVSGHLHDNFEVGTEIEIFPPAGDFTLKEKKDPVVLIAAGVGITPLISMFDVCSSQGRDVTFIHCSRNSKVQAFRQWIEEKSEGKDNIKVHHFYNEKSSEDKHEHRTGFLSEEVLDELLPKRRDIDVYFLGPKIFMAKVRGYLRNLGFDDKNIHYEFFGPAASLDLVSEVPKGKEEVKEEKKKTRTVESKTQSKSNGSNWDVISFYTLSALALGLALFKST